MLIKDQLEALKPQLTLELAHGWEVSDDRWCFIEDEVVKGRVGSPGLIFEIGSYFCELLDAETPWTQRDEMIGTILRRTFRGESEPSVGDHANAMGAMYAILDILDIDKKAGASPTLLGTRAYLASKKRYDTLRDLV